LSESAPSSGAFCALIDRALSLGGSFFLTCHKWANRTQVEQAHPRFAEFLTKKKEQKRSMIPRGVSKATGGGITKSSLRSSSRALGARKNPLG
jgi:hypothetical protein